tara:strand:+ start:4060 stop:4764 length:705 start_codon:yes stop_codon:yes gene_type:complete
MVEGEFQIHAMPAVYVLETQMPQNMIDDVNDYMDDYRKDKNKESLAKTLVGQIDKGEQLLLDHNDKKMVEYNNFICNLGVEYINHFSKSGNNLKGPKQVQIDETWSVHSYDGDYNPIHDHGTKTVMGLSTTAWTKVPPQIGSVNAQSPTYSLYNESGHSDGCIAFQYGQVSVLDGERLKPAQSFVMTPEVGKLLIFPSWLQHMVYPFKGEGERRTIASNLNCWDVQLNTPKEVQ